MSTRFRLYCRRCTYKRVADLGPVFTFPVVYRKILETAESGKLGEDLQRFVAEHPEGVLNCETVLVTCRKCFRLQTAPDLSMFLPKRPDVRPPAGIRPVSFRYDKIPPAEPIPREDYALFQRYEYTCRKCKEKMRTIHEQTLRKAFAKYGLRDPVPSLICPECEKPLYFAGMEFVD